MVAVVRRNLGMSSYSSKYRILIGFVIVMMLMAMVAGTGLIHLAENNHRMETIVDEHNVKTGYIVTMYTAARERSITLLRMLSMEDPFERDEEYMRFNKLALDFASARISLSEMPLDDEELQLHNEQGSLTSKSVPLQEQVVQLLVDEDTEHATRILLDLSIPAQDRVLEQLVRMLEHQQKSAHQALNESRDSYRTSILYISMLSAVAIGFGLLIASFVMRRTSEAETVLSTQVHQERKLRKQLSYQASHDALTGLINRFEFENRLRSLLEVPCEEGTTHALLYIDLDQFKVVNDTCGHVAGDELLRQLSLLLKNKIRSHDILARLGGDEFGMLLEYCAPDKTVSMANLLLATVQEFRFAWENKTFVIGASIGVVIIDKNSKDITTVMSAADAACYSAKDNGRNRIHVFKEDDAAIAGRHGEMQWVTRITEALENDDFQLYCQRITPVDNTLGIKSEMIEILVRMEDKDGKLIPPGAFIPAAERYNLMVSLDRWVVKETFEWLSNSPATKLLSKCSINLSGQSISDSHFLDYLVNLINETDIPEETLCFEITETSAITNLGKAQRLISELQSIGCSFALDDFGSGISSFAYLKNLPVDFLKIDGSFVKDIAIDPIDQAMVRSINEIGHVMGKKTIAEFVENDEILHVLQDIGVDYAQGFGIHKPVPLDNFIASVTGT